MKTTGCNADVLFGNSINIDVFMTSPFALGKIGTDL